MYEIQFINILGLDWLTSFLRRCGLAVRSPEATSLARQSAFNRGAVEGFFEKLSDVYER